MKTLNELLNNKAQKTSAEQEGTTTGICALDTEKFKFRAADLILLAAAPMMGKTTFAISQLLRLCSQEKLPTLYLSTQHTSSEIVARIIAAHSDKALKDILNKEKQPNVENHLKEMPVIIDHLSNSTYDAVINSAIKAFYKHKVKFIIIDSLERINGRYTHVLRQLKNIAMLLNIPILVLFQLDDSEINHRVGYEGKYPYIMDLGHTDILNIADSVLMAHSPEYYGFKETLEGNTTKRLITIFANKMCGFYPKIEPMEVYYNETYSRIEI